MKTIALKELVKDIIKSDELTIAVMIVEKLVSAGLIERNLRVNGFMYPDFKCIPDGTRIETIEVVFSSLT